MNESKKNSRFLPYEADFDTLNKWRRIGVILLYLVSALSILIPFVSNLYKSNILLKNIFEFANYIFIVSYYVVNVVTETFLYPATARLRRMGFIDNALGSKFLGKPTENYFTNDAIQPGAYKIAVNCFENCYFTYNISRGMHVSVITKNVLFAFVFLSTAYIGLKDNSVGLPILQVLLSSLFITELIHHLNFVSKLQVLLEKFKLFFMDVMENRLDENNLHRPILLLLDYETTLAYNKAPLSDRVYKKLNKKLSAEWEELKEYYEIIK